MKSLFIIVACLLLINFISTAQSGTLDKSFANQGILIGEGYTGSCKDLIVQPDKKIIAIGEGGFNNKGGFLLVRYNDDGTIDMSFGEGGKVVTSFEDATNNYVKKAVLQSDAKILAVGYITLGKNIGNNIGLVRYNENGALDSSFGINGKVTTQVKGFETPTGIDVQSDGKIVVAGYTSNPTENGDLNTVFILRYNSDGSIDKSFGEKGIYQATIVEPIILNGFALSSDGNMFIGGNYKVSNQYAFFIRKVTSAGTIDINFGVNGQSNYPFSGVVGSGLSSIAIQTDNKILAAGHTNKTGYLGTPTIVRFTENGIVDESFGNNGLVLLNLSQGVGADINDLGLQADGKIVTATRNYDDYPFTYSNFSTTRLNNSGKLDSSFATNGMQITALDGYANTTTIALQSDGKIILGGDVYKSLVPAYYFALTRYTNDETGNPLYVKIKKWLHHHGIVWGDVPGKQVAYYAIERSNNGSGFSEIARIFKQSNGGAYSYEDIASVSGTNNYRVRTVGVDGALSFSNIISIEEDLRTSVKIYPNPVKNSLHIEGLPATGQTKLLIVDFTGNVKASVLVTGRSYNWNVGVLPHGGYVLRVEGKGMDAFSTTFMKE